MHIVDAGSLKAHLSPPGQSSISLSPVANNSGAVVCSRRTIMSQTTVLPNGVSETDLPRSRRASAFSAAARKMAQDIVPALGLVGLMEDLGPACAVNESAFMEVLQRFPALNAGDLAKVMAMLARSSANPEDSASSQVGLNGVSNNIQHPDRPAVWNVDVVLPAIKAAIPETSPQAIAGALDTSGFFIPNAKAFVVFMEAWRKLSSEPFPLNALLRSPWSNTPGQLSFISQATLAPPEVFTFEHADPRLAPLAGSPAGRPGGENGAWLSQDLLVLLATLSRAGYGSIVVQILEQPSKTCPEMLLVGMCATKQDWGIALTDIFDKLIPHYVVSPGSDPLIQRMWSENSDMVVRGLSVTLEQSLAALPQVLRLCLMLDCVLPLLHAVPFNTAMDLAIAAEEEGKPVLEDWLHSRLSANNSYVQILAENVMARSVTAPKGPQQQTAPRLLAGNLLVKAIRQLIGREKMMSPELAMRVTQLRVQLLFSNPDLRSASVEIGALSRVGLIHRHFDQEVEMHAVQHIQNFYAGIESPESLLAKLKNLKHSASSADNNFFACVVQTLFDEYRFFPEYPEAERNLTATLNTGLITEGLLEDFELGEAFRLLLSAVDRAKGDLLCEYACKVLRAVTKQIVDFSQIRQHLLQNADLKAKDPELLLALENGDSSQNHPQLGDGPPGFGNGTLKDIGGMESAMGVQVAEQALAEPVDLAPAESKAKLEDSKGGAGAARMEQPPAAAAPAGRASTPFGTPAVQATRLPGQHRLPGGSNEGVAAALSAVSASDDPKHRAFHSVNPEILEVASQDQELKAPPVKIQDKISFMINNLTASNVEEKAKELKGMLSEEFWGWFCTYIVIKRAAQEPNFQHLYEALIAALEEKELWRMMVATTYKYVRVLLSSPSLASNYSERMLLKSLGSWLGRLTLAKGQPIRHKDLDLKGIVLDAYEEGKMIAILPFINKVLECCKESKVFKASNPYISAILSLMAEIYATSKLKLNLCFEIEMLFRSFGLTISETRVSKELTTRKRDMTTGVDYTLDKPAGETSVAGSLPPPSPAKSVPGAVDLAQQGRTQAQSQGRQAVSQASHVSIEPMEAASAASRPLQSPVQGSALADRQQDKEIISNLHNLVVINPSLQHLSERLKRIVPTAVDRAVAEIIGPVVDRSVQIACVSTESLILRDYACEEDEAKMRQSAHLMASTVAGCMAIVTCKELLRSSLANSLRNYLNSLDLDPNQLEGVVQMITTDNIDLGCSCIEKATVDKAIRDINERLSPAFKARQQAVAAGQPFVNMAELRAKLPASLPDSLVPKSKWLTPQQQRVYEDFARIQRAAPTTPTTAQQAQSAIADKSAIERAGYDEPAPAAGFPHLIEAVLHWQHRLEVLCSNSPQAVYRPDGGELSSLVNEIASICPEGKDDHAIYAARKILARTFEVTSSLYVTASIAALSLLKAHATRQTLVADITQTWANMVDERKWRKDVCEALIRSGLLSIAEFDMQVFKRLTAKQSFPNAVECALHMIQSLVLASEPIATGAEFYHSMDAIQKLIIPQLAPQLVANIQPILDQARRVTKFGDSIDIPNETRAQVKQLFEDWLQLLETAPSDDRHNDFVSKLHSLGYLDGNDNTDIFFKALTVLTVASSATVETPANSPKPLNYHALDSFVRLCLILVNWHSGGTTLLKRILNNVAVCLHRDAEYRSDDFNGRPYFRILLGFISETSRSEDINTSAFDQLGVIASVLLDLQPLQVPGFAFQWLEIVSLRNFMPRLVSDNRGWPHFQRLLISLLRFLEPYLRQAELTDSVRLLYKGTLRVLLVLLHDFPEFLCEYHFKICNAIPPSCIQMRNLILSAFPRNMRLPDPFTPNLRPEMLPEISATPMFRAPSKQLLSPQIRDEVDTYLQTKQMSPFLVNIRSSFMLSAQEAQSQDTRYNVPLLNAFVFYVGIKDLTLDPDYGDAAVGTVGMEIFVKMTDEMDTEGRYLFLNALANQLRYPNNHTQYFSGTILNLFHDAKEEIIQEQITRVLLERLIVNRPHPWGLLITFIELIKNPHYNFWQHKFTRCAGEIERLFDSVARSCMNSNNAPSKKEEGGTQRPLMS